MSDPVRGPRFSARQTILPLAVVVLVIALAVAWQLDLGQGSARSHYPAITVTNGLDVQNLSWRTNTTVVNATSLGITNSTAFITLNQTGAVSTFTLELLPEATGGGSGTGGTIFYELFADLHGKLSAGLVPTGVIALINDSGINQDPVIGMAMLAWLGEAPTNMSPPYYDAESSLNASTGVQSMTNQVSITNDSPLRAASFFFQLPLQILVELEPLHENTTALTTFQLEANLDGLGQTVQCSVTIVIADSFSQA